MSFRICHLSKGIRCSPRYVYRCFGLAEKCCSLYVILCDYVKALKTVSLSLVLFGLHVMAHLARFRFVCARSTNFRRLVICGWRWFMLFTRFARSFSYALVVHVLLEVLNWVAQ